MRKRLSKQERRTDILSTASNLFQRKGYAETEMEDIRTACEISRGGLYHHFGNKEAILGSIVAAEVEKLVEAICATESMPIVTLLEEGSSHLGREQGIVGALKTKVERTIYLSILDQQFAEKLSPALSEGLKPFVVAGVNCSHVAELFLTINAHINRRTLLQDWSTQESRAFAVTALKAMLPFFADQSAMRKLIGQLVEPTV